MDVRKLGRLWAFSCFAVMVVVSAPAWAKTTAFFGTGSNVYGQLGMGEIQSRPTFTLIPGMQDAASMVAGSYTSFGLKEGGNLFAAGANGFGELGVGEMPHQHSFRAVTNPTGVNACSAGNYHTVALKDGVVWSTGLNDNGALGLGDYAQRDVFTQVSGLTNVTAVAAGAYFTFARKSDGTLWGTGQNIYGQLGRGYTTSGLDPSPNTFAQATGITNVTAVDGGDYHALALDGNGVVRTTGLNNSGQLGVADTDNRNVFTQVVGITGVVTAIAAGEMHSLALTSDGVAWVSGSNGNGQLGIGAGPEFGSSFQQAPGLTNIIAIAAAKAGSLAVKSDGTLWVAGDNSGGGLGLGSKLADVYAFTRVPGLAGVHAVTAGWGFAIVQADYGVQVTYPSAADITLERGRTYNITWDTFNLPPKSAVKIELVKGGSETWTLCESTTKMPFKWTVGKIAKGSTLYPNGDDYRIRVSVLDGSDSDESDNDFAIGQVEGLTIAGPATVTGGNSQQYTCTAQYDLGADQDVTNLVKWSCAKIKGVKMGKTGVLATTAVGTDTPCDIAATYGKGKPPISDTLSVLITN